jgi:hypothetical protein
MDIYVDQDETVQVKYNPTEKDYQILMISDNVEFLRYCGGRSCRADSKKKNNNN